MENLIEEISFKIEEMLSYSDKSRRNVIEELGKLLIYSCKEFINGIKLSENNIYYLDLIEIGLKRFDVHNFDTEEREIICTYYEKIMDIIKLESSGGLLNKWFYGFDIK